MKTKNAVQFIELRELFFSSMIENCLTEMISLISVTGDVIYSTPFFGKTDISHIQQSDILKPYETFFVPHLQIQSQLAFDQALANPGVPITHQNDVLRKDGVRIYIESTYTNMLHLESVNAILIIDRDVTLSCRAEKKLKESEELFRLLVESIKEYAIYMIDPNGYVMSWNLGAELILGYPAKEIIGKHFSVFYSDIEIAQLIPNKYIKITKDEGRFEILDWRLKKDSSLFWADQIFSSLYGETGNLRGYVNVIRDITESKKLGDEILVRNEKLEEKREQRSVQLELAHKELETFSYSVSHDLRAPLRAISGFSEILQEDYGSILDEEAKRLLSVIILNSNRMSELIDDLLTFSRTGRLEIKTHSINMQSLVESALEELLLPNIKAKYETLIHHLPPCQGDYSMMKQVWINLIDNAIKYSSKKLNPIIEIGCKESEFTLTYFIRDNGVGFDMKYSNKLFGVFQRLHHYREFEGTGLGLALVKRIIQKHSGEIWAESYLDNGAMFSFQLPKLK